MLTKTHDTKTPVQHITRSRDGTEIAYWKSGSAICSLEASLLTPHLKKLILYEPPVPAGVPIYSPKVVSKLEELLREGKHEEVVSTFMREIVRMPEEQLRVMQSLPAWKDRVAAAHTIVREIEEQSDHYAFHLEKFRAMKVPALLLLGSASPAYFKAAIDLVHKALPASQIALLAGQQHAAMDTGKEIFLKLVLEFLSP